jgi:DnaJ-class molecular chaperone
VTNFDAAENPTLMADLYSQLNVARGASEADIKKAYRKLAKELHPDKNKDNPKATERFSKVTQAYDILTDKDKRAQYDRGEIDEDGNPKMPFGFGGGGGGRPGAGGAGGFRGPNGEPFEFSGGGEAADISDLFEGLFGGARRGGGGPFGGFGRRSAPPQKGADMAYRLDVSFEDAAALQGQRVTLGSGKTLDIKLPPGVEDGAKIRLAGQGQPGPGGNGDAIVTIAIKPHRFFRREGDNIRLDLPVAIDEAALGAKVRVPTVDGPVMLSVPRGATSGKVLRLKGKGFTGKGGARGDQLVTLMVDVPDDAELAAFLEGWSGRGKGNPRAGLGV